MKITVVGMGYVGLSLSILLSQKNHVTCLDISKSKVDSLNEKKSPIVDSEIAKYLSDKKLNLTATLEKEDAYKETDFVIIATPTNFNVNTNSFDTSSIENVISDIESINPKATIVIKSTVPIGFTNKIKKQYKSCEVIYSPEFLREGKALTDNLYPSRIVVGDFTEKAKIFANLLVESSLKSKNKINIFYMNAYEAESVKLFSNSYLAMRVAFFNELDIFCETNSLSAEKIITAVSSDPRIGNYYNNPSFGYGGYCLPKDTKQLLESFNDTPNSIIESIVEANKIRKNFIANSIISKSPRKVGIYRLLTKDGSDNFRDSAIIDIIEKLKESKISIILYEPLINQKIFSEIQVVPDLDEFINLSDLIVANRLTEDLDNVKDKVYSRDLFHQN